MQKLTFSALIKHVFFRKLESIRFHVPKTSSLSLNGDQNFRMKGVIALV